MRLVNGSVGLLGPRLFQRDAGLQPRDHLQIVSLATRGFRLSKRNGYPKLIVARGKLELRRHNPDNSEAFAI